MTTGSRIWVPAFAGTTNRWRIGVRRTFALPLLAALIFAAAAPAQAQEAWPQRPVTIIVPFAAGGSAGFLARILPPHPPAEICPPLVVGNQNRARRRLRTRFVCQAPAH